MNEYTARLEKIEEILRNYLPQTPSFTWQTQVFNTLSTAITQEHFIPLIKPCYDLLSLGGKRWRPLLLVLCAECELSSNLTKQSVDNNCDNNTPFDYQQLLNAAYNLVPLVEFVHTASLIHDDIEDSADTRRGKPAAHITWGVDTAINAGSWLYFTAADCIEQSSLPVSQRYELYKLYTTEVRRLHLGQAMDIAWHKDKNSLPSPDEYTAMVKLKTGTLATLAAKIGIIAGGGSKHTAETIGNIAADIGVGFQILDDVINLTTGNPGKQRGDDIVEGKKSLPILIHLENHKEHLDHIVNCFNTAQVEGVSSPAVEECIGILNSVNDNAITASAHKGKELINKACDAFLSVYHGSTAADLIVGLFTSMCDSIKL